ncbi:MAG TPA: hypothetical protein VK040_06645 [Balneolaceae bacterium]|nr:hypothetical protein [Balneolaceae bacterium]
MRVQHFLYAIILFAGLFSSGCQQQPTLPGSSSLQLEVVKEITLSPEVAEHLGNVIHQIPASPTENLLALSNSRSPIHIVVVDYNGDLVEVVGSEGRGPEELTGPRHFGFDHASNIVVYDYGLGLFKAFDRATGTVSSATSPFSEGLLIMSDGVLNPPCYGKWYAATQLVTGVLDETVPTTAVFGEKLDFINSFGSYDPFFLDRPDTRSVLQGVSIHVDCDNKRLYTTNGKVPFVQIYDLENQSLIHRTEEIPPSFMLSNTFISTVYDMETYREFRRDEQSSNTKIFSNDQFIITSFFNNTTEFIENLDFLDRNYFLAAYSKNDFSFVDELKVDGAIYGITRQGYLIEIIDDNPENFTIRFLDIQPVAGDS